MTDPVVEAPASAQLDGPDLVARGIAIGLADSAARGLIRDYLRASPLVEHKAILTELISSSAGVGLLAAIEKGGVEMAAFQSALVALPPTQFYLPAKDHRLKWTATPELLVAANMEDGPALGWDSNGNSTTIAVGGAVTKPLFLLQGLEPTNRRIKPQARVLGATVQDPDDGEWGGSMTWSDSTGATVRRVEFADGGAEFLEDWGGGGGGGGGGSNSGTWITRVINHNVCDNICISEGLEFVFKSKSQSNPNVVVSAQYTGVPTCGWPFNLVTPCTAISEYDMKVSPYRVTSGWVQLGIYETDSWPNADDPFVCAYLNGTPHPACLPGINGSPQTFEPRLGFGFWGFPLCEDTPWNCPYGNGSLPLPSLEMEFYDVP